MRKGVLTGMALLFTLAAGTTAFAAGGAAAGREAYTASANSCSESICDDVGRYCGAAGIVERRSRYNDTDTYCPPATDGDCAAASSGSGYCMQDNMQQDCIQQSCMQSVDADGNVSCSVHGAGCISSEIPRNSGEVVSGRHHSEHHGSRHH